MSWKSSLENQFQILLPLFIARKEISYYNWPQFFHFLHSSGIIFVAPVISILNSISQRANQRNLGGKKSRNHTAHIKKKKKKKHICHVLWFARVLALYNANRQQRHRVVERRIDMAHFKDCGRWNKLVTTDRRRNGRDVDRCGFNVCAHICTTSSSRPSLVSGSWLGWRSVCVYLSTAADIQLDLNVTAPQNASTHTHTYRERERERATSNVIRPSALCEAGGRGRILLIFIYTTTDGCYTGVYLCSL